MGSTGPVDNLAQHRQGVTLYLNERLASLATLHKEQYETRIAREMEKRERYAHEPESHPSSLARSDLYVINQPILLLLPTRFVNH